MTMWLAITIGCYLFTCGFAYHAFYRLIEEVAREALEEEGKDCSNLSIQLSGYANLFVACLGLIWPATVITWVVWSLVTNR